MSRENSTPGRFYLELTLASQRDTERLGRTLATILRSGDVVLLYGSLGAGKTALARAIIRALTRDADEEVPSPTFTLVQVYDPPPGVDRPAIWHFDLYRLRGPEEIVELGFEDALDEGICLIEWPDRVGALMPEDRLEVYLDFSERGRARADLAVQQSADSLRRRVTLHGVGAWEGRLKQAAAEGSFVDSGAAGT